MQVRKLPIPLWICVCYLFWAVSKSHQKRVVYSGYETHRFFPNTDENLKIMKDLQANNPGVIFLKQPGNKDASVDVVFPPHLQTELLTRLQNRMPNTLISDDIESMMDHETHVTRLEALGDNNFPMDMYWDLATLYEFYSFMEEHPSKMCKIEKYGESFEKRDLLAAIVNHPTSTSPNKPVILVDANTHAREWITYMTCAAMLNDVMTNPTWLSILEVFTMIFICCVNPDGLEYSWNTNRLWRKTRTTNEGSLCDGVDPNRNYAFGHRGEGSSTNPCDETYAGEAPFSIAETRNLKNFAESKNVFAYLCMHSYSQMALLSYGCTDEKNVPEYKDFQKHLTLVNQCLADLKAVHGTKYTAGNSGEILYKCCGTSSDWMKAKYKQRGVKHSYTFELTDTGRFGFLVPADQIKPTSEEFTAGMLTLCKSFKEDFLQSENEEN